VVSSPADTVSVLVPGDWMFAGVSVWIPGPTAGSKAVSGSVVTTAGWISPIAKSRGCWKSAGKAVKQCARSGRGLYL
jgi:hypothetical protein